VSPTPPQTLFSTNRLLQSVWRGFARLEGRKARKGEKSGIAWKQNMALGFLRLIANRLIGDRISFLAGKPIVEGNFLTPSLGAVALIVSILSIWGAADRQHGHSLLWKANDLTCLGRARGSRFYVRLAGAVC